MTGETLREFSGHPDERTLELYVLKSDLVKDRRDAINRHLRECPGCAALYKEIESYYAETTKLQEAQEEKAAHALYAPDRAIQSRGFGEYQPAVRAPRSIHWRFIQSVRTSPLRWSAGVFVVVGALALLLPPMLRDRDIAYVRAKEEFIVTFNKGGEEVWRKHVGQGYDLTNIPNWIGRNLGRALELYDVDGDGHSEVLAVFGWTSVKHPQVQWDNRILCLNADGTERWHYDVHRKMTLGGIEYSDNYKIAYMVVGDPDHDGKSDVFIGASHAPWYPNVIIHLNGSDGSVVGEYWHAGITPHVIQKDIDGDGIDELLLAGQDNRLRSACLLVLDPRFLNGCGPMPHELMPDTAWPGTEKYYLLFPPTDLKAGSVDITNTAHGLTLRANGQLEMMVLEPLDRFNAEVYYYLDSTLACVRVALSDHFNAAHKLMEDEGKVTSRIDGAYLERLRSSVQYWDGERFVNKPTPVLSHRQGVPKLTRK